ncbi:choice-of-anchor A family protein [Sphingobium sp. AP49]|uniref:choice-of-anchor A family protein n=1 Tax=Sphingobium sp. AP49 TaxID=1144307 RepID=UPI00026EE114|nr:choice-of-anchor A family protein [Sphingobium sp. AP49]WHO37673.1 choice-of-anchor A family protein [Sphingobium sp. AP49]
MKKTGFFLIATTALSLASPLLASPVSGTDALREWNLVVLGNLDSSSEVEGRTFVGGDLTGTSSSYQISTPATSPSGQPGLTVVGNVTGGIKNLNNGAGAVIGGNVDSGFNLNGATQSVKVGGTISNTNVNQNSVQSGLATSDPGFASALATQGTVLAGSMKQLSTDLSGLAANSDMVISGNRATFNAAPDANGLAVFSISATDLDKIGEIAFNLNGADTAVVNVSGDAIHLNDNFLGGTANLGEHVIWNFGDAQSLDLTNAWGGSVLAPWASATTSNYIQGSAIFGSLTQNGEMHLGTYEGGYTPPIDPPTGSSSGGTPIPEAPSWSLFLLGIAGVLLGRRLIRKPT